MKKGKAKWKAITNREAHAITGSALIPNVVYPYPVDKLPTSLQGIPGLYASFNEVYVTSSISPEGVQIRGKLAAIRHDAGVGKSYLYVFGTVPGKGVFYTTGLVKDFDGHHFPDTGSIPIDKIFENLP